MKILENWIKGANGCDAIFNSNGISLDDLRRESVEKIAVIQNKIAEIDALYNEHFKDRYTQPKTEDERLIHCLSLTLAKERHIFLEFLRDFVV